MILLLKAEKMARPATQKRRLEGIQEDIPQKKLKEQDLVKELKDIINNVQEGSDTGTFVFGTKKFNDTKLLRLMLEILVKKLPIFDFVREEGKESPSDYSIVFTEEFNEEQSKLLVDKLLLNGSACIFHGDKEIRKRGLILWAMAMKLREKNAFLEFREEIEQTAAEKMAFN
jgi:hypothetical protein